MRRAVALAALLTLVAAPAWAVRDIPPGSAIFSTGYCAKATCPNEVDSGNYAAYMKSLIANANRCVSSNFSISNKGSLIQETYSLDGDNCFMTQDIPKATTGSTLVPKCCVVPAQSGGQGCQIVCRLYGVK